MGVGVERHTTRAEEFLFDKTLITYIQEVKHFNPPQFS